MPHDLPTMPLRWTTLVDRNRHNGHPLSYVLRKLLLLFYAHGVTVDSVGPLQFV